MSSLSGTTPEFDAGALPQGVTPPSGAGGRFLSDVIVGLGFADHETVNQALDGSRAPGKKLGTTLVEMGALSERQLGRAIAERYRLDFLELSEFEIDPEAVHVIGDAEMRRYDAVPVAFTEDGALVVAMIDPADWLAAEEMAQLTGRRIRRAVAAPSEVIELISRVAEARSARDGDHERGSGAGTSSDMPSRLTLRPVTRLVAGRALGRQFGVVLPVSEGSTLEGHPPAISPEAPAQDAGTERAAVEPPSDAIERRVIPLTSRTGEETPLTEAAPAADLRVDEEVATDQPSVVESAAEGLEAETTDEVEPEPELAPSGLDTSNEQPEAADREPQSSLAKEEDDSARPQADLAEAEAASGASPHAPADAEGGEATPEQPVAEADDMSAGTGQVEQVRTELAGARAELDRTHAALARVRDELETTGGELASARSRHDGALERAAETERLLAESRAQAGRLEAELAAAHEQSRSLREDLSWARGQIEQRGQREEEALAELRGHIEAMKGLRLVDPPAQAAPSAVISAEPAETTHAPPSNDAPPPAPPPAPAPVPAPAPEETAAPSTNGAWAPRSHAPPSPVEPEARGDESAWTREPHEAPGTTKARGLKRLIAAVRRL